MPSRLEIERRYANLRRAMERDRLDALIVCGNQYAGFEGAVRYLSGFEIVHRYAYVVLPLEGVPVLFISMFSISSITYMSFTDAS